MLCSSCCGSCTILSTHRMDPNFRQALQKSPELLKAYNTVRNPKKVARLDPATNSFMPTTNIDLPFPSVETPPPQVTMENLSTVLAQYHEQTVQPSLDLLSNHIRQEVVSRLDKQGSLIRYEGLALQSLEADAIRRTVLIHVLPPFTTKSQIDHNLHYLLQQAQLTDSDIQTTSNHVNTSTNAFLEITFLYRSLRRSISFRPSSKRNVGTTPMSKMMYPCVNATCLCWNV